MSRNNDYTTDNLLHFSYFKENYWIIAIDLSKKSKLKDPQQINFIGKLENHYWKTRRKYLQVFTKFCKHLMKMERQKIVNLLNSSDNEHSRFAT